MTTKRIIIVLFIAVGITSIVIYTSGLHPKPQAIQVQPQVTQPPVQNEESKIVSTKPDPLDNNIITANQVIEITFNRPLQNVPEFKIRIEPKVDYKVELSQDRKTARIIPIKPYNLGASYTLDINPDTKFDGVGNWGQNKTFHFSTIKYTGV